MKISHLGVHKFFSMIDIGDLHDPDISESRNNQRLTV